MPRHAEPKFSPFCSRSILFALSPIQSAAPPTHIPHAASPCNLAPCAMSCLGVGGGASAEPAAHTGKPASDPAAALRTLQSAIDTSEEQILASELKIGNYAESAKACMARQPPDKKGAFVCVALSAHSPPRPRF